jgi:hypothetical protein
LQLAFDTFELEFNITKLLDPEDVCDVETPDERSLITYVSMLHNRLINEQKVLLLGVSLKLLSFDNISLNYFSYLFIIIISLLVF